MRLNVCRLGIILVKDMRGDIGSVVRENHGGLGKEGRGDKCVYIWSRYTGLPENPHRWDRDGTGAGRGVEIRATMRLLRTSHGCRFCAAT